MDEKRYREAERSFWSHYGATPRETWLALDKPATEVRFLEIGEGRPVLFLHGGPGAATLFAPLAAHMGDVRCLLVDRPGCGLSPPIDYSRARADEFAADFVCSCLDALGLEEVDIVASSFGGTCAIWFAQRHPKRVTKMAFVGCPVFLTQTKMTVFLRLLATPALGFLLARLPANRSGTLFFARSMGEQNLIEVGGLPEPFVDWWISLGRDTPTFQNEREGARRTMTWRGMRPELVIQDEALRRLDTPMYFYWGTDDPFTPADVGKELVGPMSNATVDVVPAGHLPWYDDPSAAAARVRAFLQA